MTRVAIIIVSYNTREVLDKCLASLHQDPPATTHQILVVDNGSADGSPEMVRKQWPGVQLLETGRNLGFAKATNLGIRASTSELVLLLNSDTIVPPGALDALVAELDRQPDVAVIGPRLVDRDGRAELSFGRMMGPFNELRQKLLGWVLEARVPLLARAVTRMTERVQFPDWVSGACLLVRRTAAEEAGLLDERFFLYAEDVDFCAAIRQRGQRILFWPAVVVEHHRGRSVEQAPAESERLYRLSHLAFYEKHHAAWARWLRLYLRLRGKLPARVR